MISRLAYYSLGRVFFKLGMRSFYLKTIHPFFTPKECKFTTEEGYTLCLDARHDNLQRDLIITRKPHEPYVTQWLQNNLRPGMSVVEIGAHVGYHAVRICGMVKKGSKVVLVEPFPANYDRLTKNLRNNGLDWAHCVQAAVSDKNGESELFNPNDSAMTSLGRKNLTDFASTKVQSITFDKLLDSSDIHTLDLLKIDVEGAEGIIINNKQSVFVQKRVSTILCEFHGSVLLTDFNMEPKEFINNVVNLGYKIFKLQQSTGKDHPIEPDEIDPMKRYRFVFRTKD